MPPACAARRRAARRLPVATFAATTVVADSDMEHGPVQFVQFVRFLEGLGDGWPAIIVIGFFAGFIARMMTTRSRVVGFWSIWLLGIAGALLAIGAARLFDIPLQGLGTRFLAALAGSLALAFLGSALLRGKRRD